LFLKKESRGGGLEEAKEEEKSPSGGKTCSAGENKTDSSVKIPGREEGKNTKVGGGQEGALPQGKKVLFAHERANQERRKTSTRERGTKRKLVLLQQEDPDKKVFLPQKGRERGFQRLGGPGSLPGKGKDRKREKDPSHPLGGKNSYLEEEVGLAKKGGQEFLITLRGGRRKKKDNWSRV